jgi:uncharacterized protein HemX
LVEALLVALAAGTALVGCALAQTDQKRHTTRRIRNPRNQNSNFDFMPDGD